MDSYYKKLAEKYGEKFCVEAGYFEEIQPWNKKYSKWFMLPKNQTVIQYSGAFYPFHEGHLSIIKSAIDEIVERTHVNGGFVVLHVDHRGYRLSKGQYKESEFEKSFNIIKQFLPYKGFKLIIINEDYMDEGCSRNFTRLYSELINKNNKVYFLCGGDRANFALSFIDEGNCIVAGRSDSEIFKYYKHHLKDNSNIRFLDGNHPASSTKIRNSNI